MFGAGLSLSAAVVFAVGLLVGNVPEGLLPVITLALAVGVRELVAPRRRRQAAERRRDARLDDVICTDKTGTLTENRMEVNGCLGRRRGDQRGDLRRRADTDAYATVRLAGCRSRACNNAELDTPDAGPSGDPTEIAMLEFARIARDRARRRAPRGRRPPPPLPLRSRAQADEHRRRARRAPLGRREGRTRAAAAELHADPLARRSERCARARRNRKPFEAADSRAMRARGLRVLGLADRSCPSKRTPPAQRERGRARTLLPGARGDARPAAARGRRRGRRAATRPASASS